MKATPDGFKRSKKVKVGLAMAYATCPDCGRRHESAASIKWLPSFVTCPCPQQQELFTDDRKESAT